MRAWIFYATQRGGTVKKGYEKHRRIFDKLRRWHATCIIQADRQEGEGRAGVNVSLNATATSPLFA